MLIICSTLSLFYIRHQSTSLNNALIGRAELLSSVLAHSAKFGIFSENPELLSVPMDSIAEHKEVTQVVALNREGQILARVQSPERGLTSETVPSPDKMDEDLIAKLHRAKSAFFIASSNSLQIWLPVFSKGGYPDETSLFLKEDNSANNMKSIGFVGITMTKAILKKQIYGFLFIAVSIALAITICGSMIIFLVTRKLTQPLRQLTQEIKMLDHEGTRELIDVDSEDEIGRLAAAFNDVSESLRKKKAENLELEMQLRQAQKLESLGTLAGGIAHDFNNVLSPIFGFTEMAMEDTAKNNEIYDNLQEVLNAAIRARDLVKQILAFSRQDKSEVMPLKAHLVIKEALKLLRASLPTTIKITSRIDSNCRPILADPTNIHRILMNLCTNAYHAMKDRGGELEVCLEETALEPGQIPPTSNLSPGKYVKLTVSDTGAGMDDVTRQRIFDPYFTTKPQGEGTGMGLSVVHGIVKSYEGDILVNSELGKGTTFQLFFPRIESDIDMPEISVGNPLNGGNEKILLVDDEAQITIMMKQMLEHLGYGVTARTSSLEALEAFASKPEKYDLVITDQTMPNMTGDVLAEELMHIKQDIPVIICTGFSEMITEEKAERKGIRALLMKPVVKQELAKTIREVLDGSASS